MWKTDDVFTSIHLTWKGIVTDVEAFAHPTARKPKRDASFAASLRTDPSEKGLADAKYRRLIPRPPQHFFVGHRRAIPLRRNLLCPL